MEVVQRCNRPARPKQCYNEILHCIMLPKGTASELCCSRFVFWAKSHFNLLEIVGNDIVIRAKSKKPVWVYEAYIAVAHGGRERLILK
ncbi:unnamed protein product [Rotaria magnacalcarata]|uniref:Uncharacterized protein n=1 Tax=Rotaria magnacalcarata TaxID=392030 RepID=A0A820CHT2_9BILA|nr:unnamed protein product [Rotaria magnacalcarata]CAF4222204.1 unnamed protein product [Rotaria magnacalcarata]